MGELPRQHPGRLVRRRRLEADETFAYRLRLEMDGRQSVDGRSLRFGPFSGISTFICTAEGTSPEPLRKWGRIRSSWTGSKAPASRRGRRMPAGSAWSGDFNGWDGRRHPMRLHPGAGLWDMFLPGVTAGMLYKFEIKTREGAVLLKADPYAISVRASAAHGVGGARPAAKAGTEAVGASADDIGRRFPSTKSISAPGAGFRRKAASLSDLSRTR